MNIHSQSKYIRVSPRKMQLLARVVRKMKPQVAIDTLKHINKSGAVELRKVIESALANARNLNEDADKLEFKDIMILPGGAMKRFRAVSRGMAHAYKKRLSHINIILIPDHTPEKVAAKQTESVELNEIASGETVDKQTTQEKKTTKKLF